MTRRLVPEYIENLQTYKAGKPVSELTRERGLTKVTKLASNENPLGPSPFAIREMTYDLWNCHQYPDMHAYELKEALSKLYDLKKENIILGNGSEGIMAYIVRAFIQPGDEIVTSSKTFIGFHILARGAGAKIVSTSRTPDFRYDVKEMAKAINENTKVVYLANPDNPTGTYITKDEFDYLMEFVPAHTIVILDEAYFEFAQNFNDYPDSMNYRYDNVITLRTFSKAYGLAGLRVGYGFANEYLISNLHKVKLPFEPSKIAQKGAIGAIKDYPHLQRTLRNNLKRHFELMEFLTNHNFKPIDTVTNFIPFKTGSLEASTYMYEKLLDLGVIIRPLIANELETWVRVSIGTKDEMNHFYEAMETILPEYDKKFGRPE